MTGNAPSFWEREEWLKSPDLLIVGAGIVGASVALFYKKQHPDHDVLVVDKGIIPEGASTRNAGFACIGSISEHLADMKIAGEETVLNRIENRWRGLQLLKQTLGKKEIGFEHTGGYEIFTDDQKFDSCRNEIEGINQYLYEHLGLNDVYRETEYNGYSAVFNRVEGSINSGMMMRTLHRKLADHGVRVWWNSEVKSVDDGYVKLSNGPELNPEKTVLATNGFTSRLIDIELKPARGFVFVTEPIDELKWKGTFNYNEGYVYFRNAGNRLMLGGGRDIAKEEETTDKFGINKKIKSYLMNFADDILQLPKGWKIDLEWSGIMGITHNKEPVVKQAGQNVFVAAGLSGMGIAIGMQVAKEMVMKLVSVED